MSLESYLEDHLWDSLATHATPGASDGVSTGTRMDTGLYTCNTCNTAKLPDAAAVSVTDHAAFDEQAAACAATALAKLAIDRARRGAWRPASHTGER